MIGILPVLSKQSEVIFRPDLNLKRYILEVGILQR